MEIGFDTVGYVILCFVAFSVLLLKPNLMIYILILLTLFPIFFEIPIRLGSTNVFVEDLLLLFYCCYAVFIVSSRLITRKGVFNVPDNAKALMFFVFLYVLMHISYMLLGLYQGVPAQNAVRRFLTFSSCLYFYFPFFFLRDEDQIRNIMIFVVLISAFYPLWQLYTFIILPAWERSVTSSGTMRLSGSGMPLLACALFSILIWKNKLYYYSLALGPIISMILVSHRSILLALGATLMLVFIWSKMLTKTFFFIYLASLGLFIGFFTFDRITGHDFVGDLITRSSDTLDSENKTTVSRVNRIKENWFVFKTKPLAGIGYNYELLKDIFPVSITDVENESPEKLVLHPHNFIMLFLSRTGIIGTFIIFAIIWLALKRCYFFIGADSMLRNYGVFLFSSITFFLIMALMNTTFMAEGWIFWILCGLSVSIGVSEKLVEE